MNLSAEDTFTTPVVVAGNTKFNVVVSGTFTGTISLQARRTEIDEWITLDTMTGPDIKVGELATAFYVRAGFLTGDYSSGSADVVVA